VSKKPPSDNLDKVSHTYVTKSGGLSIGQQQFITHEMELHMPHSVYTEIPQEGSVWRIKEKHPGDNQTAMRV